MRTFCHHFSSFCVLFLLHYVSAKFHLWPSSDDLTATSDRNAESCNRVPNNYCLPLLLSIAPRFWPSKPLAGLGTNWNRYLLTILTWNRRDSTPLSASPRAPSVPGEYCQKIAVSIPTQVDQRFTQHSYPRSRLNHLKQARGKIWPKRSEEETTHKNY